MPTYSDAYYNAAALLGGDDTLGPFSTDPNGRRNFYYNAAGLYGGWKIPQKQSLLSTMMPEPTIDFYAQTGRDVANQYATSELRDGLIKIMQDNGWNKDDLKQLTAMLAIFGAIYLYDTYCMLSTPAGAKRHELTKQEQMLARNRAALVSLFIFNFTKYLMDQAGLPEASKVANDMFTYLHRAYPTKPQLLEQYTDPNTPFAPFYDVLPHYDINDGGYQANKNEPKIPWSRKWENITPELAARAVGLLNKATNEGVVMNPMTIAKAAKGEVTSDYEQGQGRSKKKKGARAAATAYAEQEVKRPKRMVKGSPEAKAYMAALRAKRAAASDESGGKKKKTKSKKKKGGSAIWDSYITRTYGYPMSSPFTF